MDGAQQPTDDSPMRRTAPRWASLAMLLVCGALSLSGCGGCSGSGSDVDPTPTPATAKDGKQKKKPDFEEPRIAAQPNPPNSQRPIVAAKPGHWFGSVEWIKANNYDFNGDLETAAVDRADSPFDLPGTPYRIVQTRQVTLEKGKAKYLETFGYLPPSAAAEGIPEFSSRLQQRGVGVTTLERRKPIERMPDWQYYFVVLAREPDLYKELDRTFAISPHHLPISASYRVARLPPSDYVPLPSQLVGWTSIAYLLWDDYDPSKLSPDQQTALLDWLHWGGQLILSGPDTLDSLKGSFLQDVLPVSAKETVTLIEKDLQPLNEPWEEIDGKLPERRLTLAKPLPGVRFTINDAGKFVPGTGELVARQRVGRGSITVTAFKLGAKAIRQWKNFDGFLHCYLMNRPARNFVDDPNQGLLVSWAPDARQAKRFDGLEFNSPQFGTMTRFLSRDVGYSAADRTQKPRVPATTSNDPFANLPAPPEESFGTDMADDMHTNYAPGLGGWNDDRGIAQASRDVLLSAAGIDIPRKQFVVGMLAIYLAVLVPLNWLLFRVFGVVEYAWAMVPVIAVVGAVGVIRLAQLNIGFARSTTEVGVLEMQPDYGRAHLTRYTALYSSLSTDYEMRYEKDAAAVMLPFSLENSRATEKSIGSRNPSRTTLTYHRGTDAWLSGFFVQSNSTAMMHSEQMLNLGDDKTLDGRLTLTFDGANAKLANRSRLELKGAGLVGKERGQTRIAWLGDLAAGQSVSAEIQTFPATDQSQPKLLFSQWDDQAWTAQPDAAHLNRLSLRPLAQLMTDLATQDTGQFEGQMRSGDWRLIAWTEAAMPGQRISPEAAQSRQVTMIVAHLRHAALPSPSRDANHPPSNLENTPSERDAEGNPINDTGPTVPEPSPDAPNP